jgi:hypothetical protein
MLFFISYFPLMFTLCYLLSISLIPSQHLGKSQSLPAFAPINFISLKLLERKLWSPCFSGCQWLIFCFSVSTRLCFSKMISLENYIPGCSIYSTFLSIHLNMKGKNSFMLSIMVLLFCSSFLSFPTHALAASFRELVFHHLTVS